MAVDQNLSSRIDLMRILLICGIVFVHVPFDPETSPYLGRFGGFDGVRIFLGDSLFRIGVPCLSAISGYLLFRRGLEKFRYPDVLKSKARTVLAPFLLWNLGFLALVLLLQRQGIGAGYFPDLSSASATDMADLAFALRAYPIDLPLYFLRDLLVCILLSPLLAFLVARLPVATCGGLFLLAVLPDVTIGIVLKKSILFSFTLGMALAIHKVDPRTLDRHAPLGLVLTLAAAVLLAIGLYARGPDYPFWLDLARNTLSILGALGFWLLSALLAPTRLGQRLARTGSLSFWIFCGHYPLLVAMWMIWNRFGSDTGYPLFYAGATAATFTILIVSNHVLSRWSPVLYGILTGSRGRGRLARPDAPIRPDPMPSRPVMTLFSQNRR